MTLADTIRTVEAELRAAEAACGTYASDPHGFHAKHRSAMHSLAVKLAADLNAGVTEKWDGARVRIAGITATSTSGLDGALHNWLTAARKREGA